MKKTSLLILFTFVVALFPVKADEGMWLLPLIEKLNSKKMSEMGFTLSAEEIYSINNSSLKDAIVHFGGGCTGEIVSKNGLLFTNHHCGYGSIQALSSEKNNYLRDGYWAMNLDEELPAKGLSVTFLESFKDVTKEMNKALEKSKAKDNDSILIKKRDQLIAKATKGNKNLQAKITSFYGGNTWYLITFKVYRDVRFVGAPPSSIGKFGGDTDNWMWPRHTGDFSVFRVYADKDNNPAEFSEDNVPYIPKQFLKISLAGVKPGDPTMIMGYPGSTNRFMTKSELIETRDLTNAIRIFTRGERQDIMMKHMEASDKVMLQYASTYSGSSNGWKKWIGMAETFKKLNVEERRTEEEERFTAWVNQKPSRIKKYGTALEEIDNALSERKDFLYNYIYFTETINRIEIVKIANSVAAIQKAIKEKPETKEKMKAWMLGRAESFYKDYDVALDKEVTAKMLEIYLDKVGDKFPVKELNVIKEQFGGDIQKYVNAMFDNSIFSNKDAVVKYINEDGDPKVATEDLAAKLGANILTVLKEGSDKMAELPSPAEGKKKYIAGTLEMRDGEAIYPDANSTMRFTYGSVMGYSPKDAVIFNYYTTIEGIMQKEDPNNWEFEVPQGLKDLYNAKDYGQYAMPNGELPVAFLSNNDITGGNSGSPILNGKGELLGLAFDGNWESMSSDVIFEPELQRCINVDVRYVLFIIDKLGGAGYLLDEMELVK